MTPLRGLNLFSESTNVIRLAPGAAAEARRAGGGVRGFKGLVDQDAAERQGRQGQ